MGGIITTQTIKLNAKDIISGEELKNNTKNCLDFRYRPIEMDDFVKFAISDEDGFTYMDSLEVYKDTLYFKCNSLL